MKPTITISTPSLLELGRWIEGNSVNYNLDDNSPQLIGWTYEAIMNLAPEITQGDAEKPARKARTPKAA